MDIPSWSRAGAVIAPPAASWGRLRLRWAGAALFSAALVLFLASGNRASLRCGQDCFGAPPLDRYGSLTYEPGHPWTSYAGSWQWSAQHGLTQVAVVLSLIGLALAFFSQRNPMRVYLLAIVALVAWLAWLSLSPPVPS